jgi:predicted component of type VI protein secretion system
MKRSVSLVASLVTAMGMLAACSSETAVGKDQLATLCGEKSSSSLNCSCFTDQLETNLAPEQFARVAKAIDQNRRFSGLVPNEIANDATLGTTVTQAQLSCAA